MKLSVHVTLYACSRWTTLPTGGPVWSNELLLKSLWARKKRLFAKFKISFICYLAAKEYDLPLIIILSMTSVSRCKKRESSNETSRVCLTVQMKNNMRCLIRIVGASSIPFPTMTCAVSWAARRKLSTAWRRDIKSALMAKMLLRSKSTK